MTHLSKQIKLSDQTNYTREDDNKLYPTRIQTTSCRKHVITTGTL